ncbi:hypothetical protein KGF57_003627 [Candida theae]|uniref:Uncharacterized protein n=1 Tax=Candida theae TaxID=1198502 RepID=A0AAD5BCL3_9ASCO|nr:uncharacterized protein KGF57_003627 [Candida theae]KAI5955495.1 hypothetical protein KGF57_003627 [Candida theae]
MSKSLFANVVSHKSAETIANYAEFNDRLKHNVLVRQLYDLEYEMGSIDEVLLEAVKEEAGVNEKEEVGDWECCYCINERDKSSEVNYIDGSGKKDQIEDKTDDVEVYEFEFTSRWHQAVSAMPGLQYTRAGSAKHIQSLITEPRLRITQSVSDKIRNRNLSLIRVNTI